jgi:hypothetical protein
VLESLNLINGVGKKDKYDFSNDENLIEIFQVAVSRYLSEVERQYDVFSQTMKNQVAKNEK